MFRHQHETKKILLTLNVGHNYSVGGLHHRLFCSGINAVPEDILNIQCKLREFAGKKWEIYAKSLETVKKGVFPSNDDFMFSK